MPRVQNSRLLMPCRLAAEMMTAPDRPVDSDNNRNDSIDGADVIHIYPHRH